MIAKSKTLTYEARNLPISPRSVENTVVSYVVTIWNFFSALDTQTLFMNPYPAPENVVCILCQLHLYSSSL